MSKQINNTFHGEMWSNYLDVQEAHIPHLDDVSHITPDVSRVLGGNPGPFQLQGTNTYLLGEGLRKILIDTGEGQKFWIDTIKTVLKDNDWEIAYVLLTHWHGDHTGGVADLISEFPYIAGRVYKNNPDEGQLAIEDGQVFHVDGATLRAVHTPGHASDHMCFVCAEDNAIFTGDNVLGHGFTVVENLGQYMESMETISDQHCITGYPAHGDVIKDMEGKIEEYKGQKKRREKQVVVGMKGLDALQGKGHSKVTARQLVTAIHGDVPAEISDLALEPFIVEVLWKLAEQRSIGFEMRGSERHWFIRSGAGTLPGDYMDTLRQGCT